MGNRTSHSACQTLERTDWSRASCVSSLDSLALARNDTRLLPPAACRLPLGGAPRAQLLSHGHQLPQMIRVMVGHEQDLAKVRLAVAVRDLREQLDRLVHRQRFHCCTILTKRA